MRQQVQFAGPFDERTEKAISAQTCINWYPVVVQTHGKRSMILKQRPGLKFDQELTAGPHRGMYIHDGFLYVVANNKAYKIDTDGIATLLGSMNTDTGFVGMASSGTELVIVDGTDGWRWNGTTFTQITDEDFVDAVQVKFIKGRFIVNSPGTGRFYISASYDATTWAALDYATAEVDPDDLIALEVDHQELWTLGEYTNEVHNYTGNTDFPFESMPGGFTEWGCAAPWSIAKGDNTVIWLAQTRNGGRQVVKATGFVPTVISSDSLEERMTGFSRVDNAHAFVVKAADKHLFYVLTFPTDNETHVYDFATGLWHAWESYGLGRFRVATSAYWNNKYYMGDAINGNLYTFDADTYADNDESIVRSRKTEHHASNQDVVFCHSLEVLVNSGMGLESGQGEDPQIALYVSNDGGITFGNAKTRSLGIQGKYKKRVKWDRLGSYRHRVYEVRVSDPVDVTIIGAFAEISGPRRGIGASE